MSDLTEPVDGLIGPCAAGAAPPPAPDVDEPITLVPIVLPLFIADVVAAYRARAAEKALQLTLERSHRAPRAVRSDPVRLRQILALLVAHAIESTERGMVAVVVNATPGGDLMIDVADTGRGTVDADRAALFEPRPSRTAGAGGGRLPQAFHLAQAIGGRLTLVRTAPGKGSVFRLCLRSCLGSLPRK